LFASNETEEASWHKFWNGNKRFLALVEDSVKECVGVYEDDERDAKIASKIVQTIHDNGGRFLQPVQLSEKETGWIELDGSGAIQMALTYLHYTLPITPVQEHKDANDANDNKLGEASSETFSASRTSSVSRVPPPQSDPKSPDCTAANANVLSKTISVPSNTDVLLGKGKRCQNHQGNLRFRYLVDEYRNEYDSANTNDERKEINIKIYNIIRKERNGRFLQEVKDPHTGATAGWVEVGEAKAREKVSMCFRSKRRVAKKSNDPSSAKTPTKGSMNRNKRSRVPEDTEDSRCGDYRFASLGGGEHGCFGI
jgi:hypothetical protein